MSVFKLQILLLSGSSIQLHFFLSRLISSWDHRLCWLAVFVVFSLRFSWMVINWQSSEQNVTWRTGKARSAGNITQHSSVQFLPISLCVVLLFSLSEKSQQTHLNLFLSSILLSSSPPLRSSMQKVTHDRWNIQTFLRSK